MAVRFSPPHDSPASRMGQFTSPAFGKPRSGNLPDALVPSNNRPVGQ
jgi:hypothetical protein